MIGYILKCDKCGYYNPNPTQYSAICNKCHKPLLNSYRNWCKKSSTDSFEEYLKNCCEKNQLKIEPQIVNTPPQTILKENSPTKKTNFKKRKDPFLALILSIFLGPLGVCYTSMIAGIILFSIPTFNLISKMLPVLEKVNSGEELVLFSWFDTVFLGGIFNTFFNAFVTSIYIPFWIIGIPLSVIIAYVKNSNLE